MKIATWNVNSIKARLPNVERWLRDAAPDVVLLQETKVVDDAFPKYAFDELGYNVACRGQKTYNGVAIASKQPIDVLADALPGDANDDQARYLEAFTGGIRVVSLYVPNGNPVDTGKFDYKLRWLDRFAGHVASLLAGGDVVVLGGDYNVAPTDDDVHDPAAWRDDALCRPEARAALRAAVHLGLTDAVDAFLSGSGHYTWWDYRRAAFETDQGLRIDHLLLSPQAADRLLATGIDREPRSWEKASDHAPVWCTLSSAS